MQRSWHKARFLIACSALLAYLPGCGPSEVELKLIVTKQGSNTPEVELVFPGAEPRVELDEGETYEFTLLGRLKGDTQFTESSRETLFRTAFDEGLSKRTVTAMTSLKELKFVGEPGRYQGNAFQPSGDPSTEVTLTLAVRGVTPSLDLEIVGRGSVLIDEQEFREGRSTVDFDIGDTPKVTITEPEAFLGWSGSCVNVAGVDVNAPEFMLSLGRGDKLDCKAEFLPEPVQVSVVLRSTNGAASPGRVTSIGATIDGTSIDCTSSDEVCEVTTEQSTDLQLSVETNEGFIFKEWSDAACAALQNPGRKEITAALSCTAMFRPECEQLAIDIPQGMLNEVDGLTYVPAGPSILVQVGTVLDHPIAVEYALFDSMGGTPDFRVVPSGNPEEALSFRAEHPIVGRGYYTLQLRITHDACGTTAEQTEQFEFPLRGL